MGEAAKISLKAIGKQDTYLLCKDPAESFFNPNTTRRHSDFRNITGVRMYSIRDRSPIGLLDKL